MLDKEPPKSKESVSTSATTTTDGSPPSRSLVTPPRKGRRDYKVLRVVLALSLALIGLAADLSELTGQSVVRKALTPLAENPAMFASFILAVAGACIGIFYFRRRATAAREAAETAVQRLAVAEQHIQAVWEEAERAIQEAITLAEKNKRLADELEQVTENAWNVLNNRVKRDDVTAVESRVHYTILNERGDCDVYKRLVVRTGGLPCRSIEWYVASSRGRTSRTKFYASLQAEGVTVEPVENLTIGEYDIFLFRLNFDRAFSTSPVAFVLRYRVNGWFPLSKEGELGIHTLMPTDSTGCRIELPDGWEIAQKWTTWEEILHPPQLLDDKYFRPINKDGFEWQLDQPRPHGYYKVRFTARRKPGTIKEAA